MYIVTAAVLLVNMLIASMCSLEPVMSVDETEFSDG